MAMSLPVSLSMSRIGGAALAGLFALGFLGAGLAALRLPQDAVLAGALPEPPAPAPAPAPLYMGLRDPLIVAHPAGLGTVEVELGVVIDAADRGLAQVFLRDRAGAVDAPLAETLLHLIERHAGGAQGWAELRAALPEAMRAPLNDRFEAAGYGRPIREVLVIAFTAR